MELGTQDEAAAAEFCHNFFNLFVILESRKKSTVGSTMLGKKWQSIAAEAAAVVVVFLGVAFLDWVRGEESPEEAGGSLVLLILVRTSSCTRKLGNERGEGCRGCSGRGEHETQAQNLCEKGRDRQKKKFSLSLSPS